MKKGLIFVITILMIIFSFSFINSANMHSGTNIYVNVDGTFRSLESGYSYFYGSHSYSLSSSFSFGHNPTQVWVSVQNGEMTLFNALSSTHKLCPNPSKPTTYSNTNIPNPSHVATEIYLSSGKTLQQAINDGNFCTPIVYTYSWYVSGWSTTVIDACSNSLTRTVYCQRNDGTQVADSYCSGTKPYSSTSTQDCHWKQGSTYYAVLIGEAYCGVGACNANNIDHGRFCKWSGGNCFMAWCDGAYEYCRHD